MENNMMQSCPHCGGTDMRIGYQRGEGLVTYNAHGVFGNNMQHLICGRCGLVLASRVGAPQKYASATGVWNR